MKNKRVELLNRVDREYRDLDTLDNVQEYIEEKELVKALERQLKVEQNRKEV